MLNQYTLPGRPFLFAIDYNGGEGFVLSPEEAARQGILCRMGIWSNHREKSGVRPRIFQPSPVPYPVYHEAFENVQRHLRRGDTYLLNLTFPTPVHTDLTLAELYFAAHAPYKLHVPGRFTVFSPERFVTIRDGLISSCPMKGTIDAAVPDAERRLLADEKEFFEHNTIVDLIRNDLSIVSTGVVVKRFRYVDRIRTHRGELLQVSSEIEGTLTSHYGIRLGDTLFALLPAGSVTGAPKEKTVQIIHESETYERGFYTGIFGYSDGRTLESAVAIRFVEQTADRLVFKSGGGITALSDSRQEYEEMIRKIDVPVI